MNKTFICGYTRISKPKQDIQRQIRNIKKEYPDAYIVSEAYTGTKIDRPIWNKLYSLIKDKIRRGDNVTLVFDSCSRMSRDASAGFSLYKELYEMGVSIVFLNEPYINTESYKNAMNSVVVSNINSGDSATDELVHSIMCAVEKFMMSKIEQDIYKAFEQAEKEVMDLRERTRQGLITATLNGKKIGAPKGVPHLVKNKETIKKMILSYSKSFNGSNTDMEVISIINGKEGLKITHNTYYKYKKELRCNR